MINETLITVLVGEAIKLFNSLNGSDEEKLDEFRAIVRAAMAHTEATEGDTSREEAIING